MRLNRVFLVMVLVAAGCATRPKETPAAATWSFPSDAFITQRAILTARGRQELRAETSTWRQYATAVFSVLETA